MTNNKRILWLIMGLSVVVPGLVAVLLFSQSKLDIDVTWVKFLPTFNALINSATAVLLLFGLYLAKTKRVSLHKNVMMVCFILGALFLVSYVTYHSTVPSVKYGDINADGILQEAERVAIGDWRGIYLALLLSHIGFSILVVPFVLFAFYYALTDQIERHRKVVKYTWPIWFYVSVTGVLVYFMISPYYV